MKEKENMKGYFYKDQIIKGKVIKVYNTHVLVQINKNTVGLCHISEMSDYFIKNIKDIFQINKNYFFKVIDSNEKEHKVYLSWKRIVPMFLKSPFSFTIKPTKHNFENLKKYTMEKINDKS